MPTKKLVLKVVTEIGEAKKGLDEVRQGVSDLLKLQQGSGRDIANGALKAFDGLHGALTAIAPEAEAVLEIAGKAVELAQFAGQREILRRGVGDVQLASLRAATQGLVDDQTLLQAAAKGMRGDFALSQAQMENVAKAAVTLHNEGFGPIPEIIADITEKLRTGEVEGLKNYGVQLGETGTKAEKLGRAHQAMGILATDGNNKASDSSVELTKLMVRLKNVFDDVKEALGLLVGGLAKLVNGTIDAVDWLDDKLGGALGELATIGIPGVSTGLVALGTVMDDHNVRASEMTRTLQGGATSTDALRGSLAKLGAEVVHVAEIVQGMVTASPIEKLIASLKTSEKAARDALDPMFGTITLANHQREAAKRAEAAWDAAWEWSERWLESQRRYQAGLQELEVQDNKTFFGDPLGFAAQVNEAAAQIGRDYEEMNDLLKRTALDNFDPITGKVKRIDDATMNAAKAFTQLGNIGKQALGQLAVAAGTSLQAIISGNEGAQASLGEVFRQFLDQIGTQMQIKALEYLAMGTAAAVTPGAQGQAAGYFTAAAIFEGAALAAGLAERVVGAPSSGGGGSSSSTSDNTTGRDTITAGSRGESTVNYVFKVGYGFIGDEKALVREMDRMMRNGSLTGTTRALTGARRA
jgi:hypothetical protein